MVSNFTKNGIAGEFVEIRIEHCGRLIVRTPLDDIIGFLDANPKAQFSEFVEKFCGVKRLENGVRDPRAFVNEKKILEFSNEIEIFAIKAQKSGDIEKFAQKALKVKSANILVNITLSSILLAIGLPKLTFYLRKLVTGSDVEPGLVKDGIKNM